MSSQPSFTGSVPSNYDTGMGPVIFEPFAKETASHVSLESDQRLLEIAAGTGRLSRYLLRKLPEGASMTITDLNQDMLDVAAERIRHPLVTVQTADAMSLPFENETFHWVLNQFGLMFLPDKDAGQREARRVLRPGGSYIFAVWDGHDANPWAAHAHRTMQDLFPGDPIGFFAIPFSCSDRVEIEAALLRAGFDSVYIETVQLPLEADSAESFARGTVEGSPLAAAVVERGGQVEDAVQAVASTYVKNFGDRPMRSRMSALIVTAK